MDRVEQLRRRAANEAARREVLRSATLSWLRGAGPGEEERDVLKQWHGTLKQLWGEAQKVWPLVWEDVQKLGV